MLRWEIHRRPLASRMVSVRSDGTCMRGACWEISVCSDGRYIRGGHLASWKVRVNSDRRSKRGVSCPPGGGIANSEWRCMRGNSWKMCMLRWEKHERGVLSFWKVSLNSDGRCKRGGLTKGNCDHGWKMHEWGLLATQKLSVG